MDIDKRYEKAQAAEDALADIFKAAPGRVSSRSSTVPGEWPPRIVRMILRDSLMLTVVGAATSIRFAMVVGHTPASSLYRAQPLDTLTYPVAGCGRDRDRVDRTRSAVWEDA